MIGKDPNKAISLFWAAINAGDRVDSALKDMACVMKQLDRADEAIEAVKSFRHLCPPDSQVSLDNLLIELYKVQKTDSLLSDYACLFDGSHLSEPGKSEGEGFLLELLWHLNFVESLQM